MKDNYNLEITCPVQLLNQIQYNTDETAKYRDEHANHYTINVVHYKLRFIFTMWYCLTYQRTPQFKILFLTMLYFIFFILHFIYILLIQKMCIYVLGLTWI